MSDRERLFNELVRDYSERVWWHVRRMVNSHEETEDLVQEIFLKVWTALPSFRGEAQLSTWLWRIASNETISYLRRERLRAALHFASAESIMASRIQADSYFNGTALQRELSKAVARLPERQRQVFVMRWWDELPFAEISAILGVSEGSLKASWHQAYEKVKNFLEEQ